MQQIITIGPRHLAISQIAWVEPFDVTAQGENFKTDKPYRARVVLVSRDTFLIEDVPEDFVTRYGFGFVMEDGCAFNKSISWSVSSFEPTESFKPEKDFKSRLTWRDAEGKRHSKLLTAHPDIVLANVVLVGRSGSSEIRPPKRLSRRKVLKLQNSNS